MSEPNTIEREWTDFAQNFPGLVENEQARQMFYSGAIAIVAMAFRVASDSPDQARGLFAKLRREIDAYFVDARRNNELNARRIILPN